MQTQLNASPGAGSGDWGPLGLTRCLVPGAKHVFPCLPFSVCQSSSCVRTDYRGEGWTQHLNLSVAYIVAAGSLEVLSFCGGVASNPRSSIFLAVRPGGTHLTSLSLGFFRSQVYVQKKYYTSHISNLQFSNSHMKTIN